LSGNPQGNHHGIEVDDGGGGGGEGSKGKLDETGGRELYRVGEDEKEINLHSLISHDE
jgi:hypothetical protein